MIANEQHYGVCILCYNCCVSDDMLGVTADASGAGNTNYRQQQTQGGPAVSILSCPKDCSTNSNTGYAVDMAPNIHWLGYTVKVSGMRNTRIGSYGSSVD
eukprot:4079-Heterococcus_DN1.PRE.8